MNVLLDLRYTYISMSTAAFLVSVPITSFNLVMLDRGGNTNMKFEVKYLF